MRRGVAALVGVVVLTVAGCGGTAPVAVETPAKSVAPTSPMAPSPSVKSASATPEWAPVDDPTVVATKSMLYRTGVVPAVNCSLPAKLVQTRVGMLRYARLMVGCMQRTWRPAVFRMGFHLDIPRVDAYTVGGDPLSAPLCDYRPPGGSEAYYEENHKTICFEWKRFADKDALWALVYFQFVIAHEFGHHLQSTVDILGTYEFSHAGSSKAVQLEDNRRMELQASCLGAAYLGANKKTFELTGSRFETWKYQVKHTGDDNDPKGPRDHGSRKSHGYWTLRAFEAANPSACNTFVAPSNRVS
jgi:Putative neutral zinc metallopeptidase